MKVVVTEKKNVIDLIKTHLIMVREMAYYDTVDVKSEANPEDLKKEFEKLTIQCSPEDNPNRDEQLKRYVSIKQEDDSEGDEKDAFHGKYRRVSSFRNANPSYRKNNRAIMNQAQAEMILAVQLVRVRPLGLHMPAVVQTSVPRCNMIADFRNVTGQIKMVIVPLMNHREISTSCQLSSGKGYIADGCLHFLYGMPRLPQNNTLFDFGPISLSWGGPTAQRKYRIVLQMMVFRTVNRQWQRFSSAYIDVSVDLGAIMDMNNAQVMVPRMLPHPAQNMAYQPGHQNHWNPPAIARSPGNQNIGMAAGVHHPGHRNQWHHAQLAAPVIPPAPVVPGLEEWYLNHN